MRKLPIFKGYTVDGRLKEFRKVECPADHSKPIEFIPFDSEEGDRLLCELIKTLPTTSRLFKEIADAIC